MKTAKSSACALDETQHYGHEGLDFSDAYKAFDGQTHAWTDKRFDCSAKKLKSVGHLNDRMVVVVWTQVDAHVITDAEYAEIPELDDNFSTKRTSISVAC